MKIEIETTGRTTSAKTPFNPDFPARAKRIGGRWDSVAKAWLFDARDEDKVRKLCVALFGTDGSPETAADVLTVRAPAKVCDWQQTSLWLCGRKVASVLGRDSGARLGDGVVLLAGKFSSGGSMKHPRIERSEDAVIELRDVPRAMAEKLHAEYHGVALLDAQGAVVAEATSEESEMVVSGREEAEIEREIAAAEGRLAGLRFRAAELRAA